MRHQLTDSDAALRSTSSTPDTPRNINTPTCTNTIHECMSSLDRPSKHVSPTKSTNNLEFQTHVRAPSSNSRASLVAGGLRVNTSMPAFVSNMTEATSYEQDESFKGRHSPAPLGSPISSYFAVRALDQRTPHSPASASLLPSPALSAVIDITPLPSPQFMDELSPRRHPSLRRSHRASSQQYSPLDALPSRSNSLRSPKSPARKQKIYTGLISAALQSHADAESADEKPKENHVKSHGRSRSISDFVPENLTNFKQRVATFGPHEIDGLEGAATAKNLPALHREANLSAQRGVSKLGDRSHVKLLPSPPHSGVSITGDDYDDEEPGVETFVIADPASGSRKWRAVKQLGHGTFSRVLLATEERFARPCQESSLDPARLAAVKIIEHGPAGGADEDRIKHSLSREVDILKTMRHPSLVHLLALQEQTARTCLVLPYCAGGDLFEFASEHRESLTSNLVQRMFAELVDAVHYLHQNWIVHRDIKLENVLVNIPATALAPANLVHPQSHTQPLVTLTDLGLSRRLSPPPASPLLTTRCGSEDYAAPEILLGQAYDGRSTDAWALGVLLYALMEGRLPFDAPPRKVDRSKNTHRIARCDWIWCRFGDEDGEWTTAEPEAAQWEGARTCVEGLLKKVRMGRKPLDEIAECDWVKSGIQVPGGLRLSDSAT